jgi:hypothetical protein
MEIEDYVTGRYSKRDKILKALFDRGNITLDEYLATDAAVTTVVEDQKINLGLNLECSGKTARHKAANTCHACVCSFSFHGIQAR